MTFRTPLHFDVISNLNPQLRPQGFVRGVGFENFYIERLQGGNNTFQFKNAAYCWIRNIESYHTQKSHITNNTTIGCEFRDSYFHRSFSYGDGGAGYGVEFGFHSTDGLCENSIFDSLRHAMLVQAGAIGCVFGYNYSINPVQGEGETNLNEGWDPPDISLHGHYARMNLFEGNVVTEIGIGDYWGPMGPGNTFLRNVVKGPGVYLYDHSHFQNLVGNTITNWIDDGSSAGTVRHGEKVNGEMVWNDGIEDHVLPVSYYLHNKPAFTAVFNGHQQDRTLRTVKSSTVKVGIGKPGDWSRKEVTGKTCDSLKKREDLPKIFDFRGRVIGFTEASSMSNSKVSSGIYLQTNGSTE